MLTSWNLSCWEEYQDWINKHSLCRLEDWWDLHRRSLGWKQPPKISIVTPVYNTDPEILLECILSVRAQAYPYWQLLLVDDASTKRETLNMLASGICRDPRIQVFYCNTGVGISGASNKAIENSVGDFVLFLDHDDRLALDALYYIAYEIEQFPDVDIVYADRDMLSPHKTRDLHLFKPGWSPDTLLSGNYIFHPMCYRRSKLQAIGGLRSQYDGSQDYDLILRFAEMEPKVRHIQKVLYHWRQHGQSVALDPKAKDYAFAAGVEALNEALKRRGISGKASEIEDLWRGNYSLQLKLPLLQDIELVQIESDLPVDQYASYVSDALEKGDKKPFLAIVHRAIEPRTDEALQGLAAWLSIEKVGLVSGKITDLQNNIHYAGMAYKKDGSFVLPYQGFPESEPGYMAVTRISRNISAPHPYCVLINRGLWNRLGGFNPAYKGPHALLDFALRALKEGWRCVVSPQHRFKIANQDLLGQFPEQDAKLFLQEWESWLDQGDPYYNSNLDKNSREMSTLDYSR